MLDVAKTILMPGTLRFALAVGAGAMLLVFAGGTLRRAGIAALVLLCASYYVAALPWTAARLSAALRRAEQVHSLADARDATAVAVISGDSADARIAETLRLNALLHPRWIVVSGPMWMRLELNDAGIPAERILTEPRGTTTREQAVNIERLLRARGITPVVLVASEIHMSRALAAFRAAGIDTIGSPSATRAIAGAPRFWPLHDALRLSRESLYEYIATAYYEWRGWLT